MMNIVKRITVLIGALIFATVAPISALAAVFELTASDKSALNKIIAASDKTTADQVNKLYAELVATKQQEQDWDKSIKDIHRDNEETLIDLRKQTKQIDADTRKKLETEVQQTKARYSPLFTLYESLNKQLLLAKLMMNKGLSSQLRQQIDNMKMVIQVARYDIRSKEDALKATNLASANIIKQIRRTMADIDPIKVKANLEKGKVSSINKQFTSDLKIFKQTVKKGSASQTIESLTTLVSLSHQIDEKKQNIYNHEQSIRDILIKAKSQIPSK
jgi:hypothetical protein